MFVLIENKWNVDSQINKYWHPFVIWTRRADLVHYFSWLFVIRFVMSWIFLKSADCETFSAGMRVRPSQASWINWVIRLTWPHLLKDQAATGAVWREKLTMLLAVMVLLWPSRLQSLSWYPVETIAAPFMELSGIEPLSEILVWIT